MIDYKNFEHENHKLFKAAEKISAILKNGKKGSTSG